MIPSNCAATRTTGGNEMIAAPTEREQNLAYARRVFETFSNGSAQPVDDALAVNATHDQLIEYFRMLREQTQGAYHLTPIAFAASGNKVFVEYHVIITRVGKSLESDGVLRLTIADGKTIEVSNHLEVCRRRGI